MTLRNPLDLFQELGDLAKPRKARLVACAVGRLNWDHIAPLLRKCVETAEAYADGRVTAIHLNFTYHRGIRFHREIDQASAVTFDAASTCHPGAWQEVLKNPLSRPLGEYEPLLRDILGGSSCYDRFSPHVKGLAQEVYDNQFSLVGVLADALEDDGAPDEMVSHLRQGRHFKGCWVVDQILEKE